MVRENKDLTIQQAQALIDENKKRNEKEGDQSIFNKFREGARQDK